MTTELPGLPRASLTRWLANHLPDLNADKHWSAEILAGGLSNITYRLHLPGMTVVLRRPPLAGVQPKAHDMVREHRVQSALSAVGFPVPKPLAVCTDPEVIGAPFYVMAEVTGQVLRTAADTAALTRSQRVALTETIVATLADLHAIDHVAVGLADFGYPVDFCARQVKRWGEQWSRTKTRQLPDMSRLLDTLAQRVPSNSGTALVHGDYRLDNTMVDLGTTLPRVAAVLDWELSTLGDPLTDLGLFMTYWHDGQLAEGGAFPQIEHLTAGDGFPTAGGIAELYATRSGRDLTDLAFYQAFGTMKLAVILEGVHARYLGGQTLSPGYDRVGPAVPALTARALGLLRTS